MQKNCRFEHRVLTKEEKDIRAQKEEQEGTEQEEEIRAQNDGQIADTTAEIDEGDEQEDADPLLEAEFMDASVGDSEAIQTLRDAVLFVKELEPALFRGVAKSDDLVRAIEEHAGVTREDLMCTMTSLGVGSAAEGFQVYCSDIVSLERSKKPCYKFAEQGNCNQKRCRLTHRPLTAEEKEERRAVKEQVNPKDVATPERATKPCFQFADYGRCNEKQYCRFAHRPMTAEEKEARRAAKEQAHRKDAVTVELSKKPCFKFAEHGSCNERHCRFDHRPLTAEEEEERRAMLEQQLAVEPTQADDDLAPAQQEDEAEEEGEDTAHIDEGGEDERPEDAIETLRGAVLLVRALQPELWEDEKVKLIPLVQAIEDQAGISSVELASMMQTLGANNVAEGFRLHCADLVDFKLPAFCGSIERSADRQPESGMKGSGKRKAPPEEFIEVLQDHFSLTAGQRLRVVDRSADGKSIRLEVDSGGGNFSVVPLGLNLEGALWRWSIAGGKGSGGSVLAWPARGQNRPPASRPGPSKAPHVAQQELARAQPTPAQLRHAPLTHGQMRPASPAAWNHIPPPPAPPPLPGLPELVQHLLGVSPEVIRAVMGVVGVSGGVPPPPPGPPPAHIVRAFGQPPPPPGGVFTAFPPAKRARQWE